ncbi:craniofacial development protein 2-like [Procambarus clarkii]|uniref:craniofacial development protein 2-like n=1 Tax=Procambarus clarkii TaxID=6728 RepID=UPI0037447AFF
MTNTDDIMEKFYEELDILTAAVLYSEKLIILKNFNARVGMDYQTWEGNIGRQGTGKCNSNGLLLLTLCTTHDLILTNTLLHLPTGTTTSGMHQCSRPWHLVDYIITRKKMGQDMRVTEARGADCLTDHRLIVSKCKLRILPMRRPQDQKTVKRPNISKLKSSKIKLLTDSSIP